MIRCVSNIQKAFLQFIRGKLGDESYAMWFDGQFQLLCGETADALYITAEAPFVLDWYRRNFHDLFSDAVRALFPTFRGTLQICTREEIDVLNGNSAFRSVPKSQPPVDRSVKSITKPETSRRKPQSNAERLSQRRQKSHEVIQVAEQSNLPEMADFLRSFATMRPEEGFTSDWESFIPPAPQPQTFTKPQKISTPVHAVCNDPMQDFVSLMDRLDAEGKIRKSLFSTQVPPKQTTVSQKQTSVSQKQTAVSPKQISVSHFDFQPALKPKNVEIPQKSVGVEPVKKTSSGESVPLVDSTKNEVISGNKLQALMANVLKLSEREESSASVGIRSEVQPEFHRVSPVVVSESPANSRLKGYTYGTFDSFVCGASNRVAFTTARSVCRSLGLVSPVLFTGGTGTGKTHLLDAIYREAVTSGFPTVYKTCEEFMNDFIGSLRDPRHKSEFQATYRQCDILILDNLQFMLNKKGTISELQNIFNYRIRHGKQIVLASDQELSALEGLGTALCSQLRGGCECRIGEPGFDVRLGILAQGARTRSLPLTLEQQRKIAMQSGTDVRELLGRLNTLEMMARAQFVQYRPEAVPVSVSAQERTNVIQQLADGMMEKSARSVSLDDIKRYVAVQFGIDVQLLVSGKRTRSVSQPRMLAMWLARKFTRKPLTEIGRSFGCTSHSTVISAQKKVEEWRTNDFKVQTVETLQSVNDILFQIENQLQRPS